MILRESREAIVIFIDYTAAFDSESQLFLDKAWSYDELFKISLQQNVIVLHSVRLTAPSQCQNSSKSLEVSFKNISSLQLHLLLGYGEYFQYMT